MRLKIGEKGMYSANGSNSGLFLYSITNPHEEHWLAFVNGSCCLRARAINLHATAVIHVRIVRDSESTGWTTCHLFLSTWKYQNNSSPRQQLLICMPYLIQIHSQGFTLDIHLILSVWYIQRKIKPPQQTTLHWCLSHSRLWCQWHSGKMVICKQIFYSKHIVLYISKNRGINSSALLYCWPKDRVLLDNIMEFYPWKYI